MSAGPAVYFVSKPYLTEGEQDRRLTFDITVIDDDGLTITNNNSYRVEINDTLGLIVPGRTEFRDNRGKTLIKSHFTMKNSKPVADNYTVEVVLENWSYRPHGDPVMSKKFVTRYLIHNTTIHVIKPPTVNLDIAAAKYSMLTALRSESEETSRETNYILQKTQLMDLQDVVTVTRSGHIYVNDSARLRSTHQTMAHLVVKETQKEIITKEFILNIRLTDNISKRGNRPCGLHNGEKVHPALNVLFALVRWTEGNWAARSTDTCVTSCGYGAVLGVCQWDVRKHVANYSQCTPSVETCPDEFCSELEMLNVHICPQDCEEGAPRRNRTVIPLDLEETNQNECLHDSGPCVSSAGQTAEDESEEVVCSISCKTGLAVSMSILLIAAVVLGLGLTAWNRTRKREPMALKHVSSLVSMAAVPSDYIVDDARDTRQHANRPNSSPASGQCPAKIALGQDVFEDKWEFPRCYLTLEHVIGEGEFGQVVRAQAFMLNGQEGNSVVAVKMLKPDASGAEYQDLVSEFQLLKEVDHPNVIKLLGVCTQKGPLYVIVEYCELGSLRSFLRSAKLKSRGRSWEDKQRSGGSDASPQAINFTRTLTFRDLLSFAWQISKGMDYLASLKIVHRDLAARNVLVTEGLKMKISDFGLSRDVYEADAYLKMSKGRMPVKWMAPESLYAQIYTTKSDVWSYGIVLWEVVTLGASPYPGIPPERLFPLLSTGYRMDRPEDCPDELYAIMQKCWKAEPENRPHFSTLREILDHLLQQNTEYLELSEDKYFLSSLEIDDRRAKVSPSYGNVCSLNKCQPDAYVSSNWPGEELGDNECPEMSKLLIPCENDLEVTKRHIYCNDGPKICDRLLVHENLTYV
ncbi:hypothetical protein Btru_071432 [Bulinus truncatus]|nr:hypothetical protein Btru_071432 [Bulinus truncatus]